ncbi:hypothetical protein V8C42DRAFT_15798 [Trichoderma barbatum]
MGCRAVASVQLIDLSLVKTNLGVGCLLPHSSRDALLELHTTYLYEMIHSMSAPLNTIKHTHTHTPIYLYLSARESYRDASFVASIPPGTRGGAATIEMRISSVLKLQSMHGLDAPAARKRGRAKLSCQIQKKKKKKSTCRFEALAFSMSHSCLESHNGDASASHFSPASRDGDLYMQPRHTHGLLFKPLKPTLSTAKSCFAAVGADLRPDRLASTRRHCLELRIAIGCRSKSRLCTSFRRQRHSISLPLDLERTSPVR